MESDATPTWVRPAAGASVPLLAILTVLTMFVEHGVSPMPASHLVAVPIAMAITTAVWGMELFGLGWPKPLFILLAVAPNLVTTLIGHTSLNYLFLLLLVAWATFTGTRRDSLLSLALSLVTVAAGFAANTLGGSLSLTTWLAWAAGILTVWFMARAMVNQEIHQGANSDLYEYDATLSDMAARNGGAIAAQAAAGLEYPSWHLGLDESFPFDLAARPLALGLAGVAALAWFRHTRSGRGRAAA